MAGATSFMTFSRPSFALGASTAKAAICWQVARSCMRRAARTTARTAERRAWSLRREEDVHEIDIRFLNRMSDYIFLLMRLEEQDVRDK